MRRYAFRFVLSSFAFVCFIFAMVVRKDPTGHHATFHAGVAWWVILGLWVGLLVGAAIHYVVLHIPDPPALPPWHVDVYVNQYGKVQVTLARRVYKERGLVSVLDPTAEDFDDQLHRAMARAELKAAALNVATDVDPR